MNLIFENDIAQCVHTCQQHGVILYPTDTVWGLGCSALDEVAIEKIMKIKNRPTSKAFIVLMTDVKQLRYYTATTTPDLESYIDDLKEPTTIIYPNAIHLPESIIAEDGSIAVRIVQDEFCRALIKRLRVPIVSTSANLSAAPTPLLFKDIKEAIKDNVDYIVQWRQDDVTIKKPSSILKLEDDDTFTKIR